MTSAELLLRVDVWIARRIKFPCDDDSPAALWSACSGSFGAASAPALGCLLAMVREAWPECDVSVHHCYGVSEDSAVIVIMSSDLSDREYDWSVWDATGYDDCLVQALEAAPQPGPVMP